MGTSQPPTPRQFLAAGAEGIAGAVLLSAASCLRPNSYMYATGYQHPGKAVRALRGWTSADIACTSCNRCRVRCALGFDLRSRALEMARLLESELSL